MTFIVVGDANADLRGALDHYPREGDDATLREASWHAGGSSANVAVALAKLGASTTLVTRVGVDPAADVALGDAQRAGVDLRFVQRDPSVATGLCFAAVSANGERTLFGARGANPRLEAVDPAVLDGASWLHIGGHALLDDPQRTSTLALLDEASRRGVRSSLDLCMPIVRSDAHRALVREISPRFAVVFGNRQEIAPLGGAFAGVMLVEKRGAEGARVGQLDVPAFVVDARDTTACGDAFVAAFLRAHVEGAPIAPALQFANAVGALTATRPGAAESTPTFEEARSFLSRHDAREALSLLARMT